jgi:hypothetical protein
LRVIVNGEELAAWKVELSGPTASEEQEGFRSERDAIVA